MSRLVPQPGRPLGGLRLLATLALLSSCGEFEDSAPTGPSAPPQRIQQVTAAQLEERRAAMEALDLREDFRAGLLQLIRDTPLQRAESNPNLGWYQRGGVTLFELYVRRVHTWARPKKPGRPAWAQDYGAPAHPLGHIVAAHERLAAQGLQLLVVPIPTRLHIYPELLPGLPADAPGFDPWTTELLRELAARGVRVVDLLHAFGQSRGPVPGAARGEQDALYFAGDNHWTPRAIQLAARAIARVVDPAPNAEQDRWAPAALTRTSERIDYVLAGVHQPAPESIELLRVTLADGTPLPIKDKQSPVVLLGDSFTLQYQEEGSDLATHIAAELGRSIDRIASSQGASRSWGNLARRGPEALATKRTVIWVFTMRALVAPELKLQ